MASASALDSPDPAAIEAAGAWFNKHHDKLLCTANRNGEPSVALMGTPRMAADGSIDFEISDVVSLTLSNLRENPAVVFIAYDPGPRARDYIGVRIYARVTEIASSGERFDAISTMPFLPSMAPTKRRSSRLPCAAS